MRQRVKIPTRWSGARLGFSMSGAGSVSAEQAVWNLPATLSVQQGGNIPLRQYALNSSGWSIVVSNLPAGVTYNSGLEQLEGAATGTSSGTATFTLIRVGGSDVVDTATVALVEVSSTLVHGELFTITGSGLGSGVPSFGFAGGASGPLETTTVGQTPTNGDGFNWQRFSIGGPATIASDAARGKCLAMSLNASTAYEKAQEYTFSSPVPAGGSLYMTYWLRGSFANQPDPAQFKLFRVCGVSDISDTNTNLVCHYLAGGNNIHENPGGTSILFYGGNSDGYWRNTGDWMRVELKILAGQQGTRNGQVHYRVFRGTSVPSSMPLFAGFPNNYDMRSQSLSYPNTTRYNSVIWQNWLGNGYTTADVALDDNYVSVGTFRRVELWNTNSPSTATYREIQEPISWNDTAISIRANRGGLADGTYYLVVLDDTVEDTVLHSQQVTLSGG